VELVLGDFRLLTIIRTFCNAVHLLVKKDLIQRPQAIVKWSIKVNPYVYTCLMLRIFLVFLHG
jgi:hypothetical protein